MAATDPVNDGIRASLRRHIQSLRSQLGVSLVEFASRAAVNEERLKAVERGACLPTVGELDRLLSTGEGRPAIDMRFSGRSSGDAAVVLYRGVYRLLDLTAPLSPLPQEVVTTWRRVPFGFFLVARENVRALLALELAGQAFHLAPTIARSVFEDVVTAFWFAGDKEQRNDRGEWILRDFHRRIEQLAHEDPQWIPRLDEACRFLEEHDISVQDFGKQLPSFKDRLSYPMHRWYIRYRSLSLESHSGWRRMQRAFWETDAGVECRRDPGDVKDLAFAATLVSQLGLQIEGDWQPQTRTGYVFHGSLDEYVVAMCLLNVFTRPGTTTVDTSFYVPSEADVDPL
jgi:hypothetical protein